MDLPIKGIAYSFKIGLEDQTNPGLLKASPTLATGDVKISKDDGGLANLATLPTVTPASGRVIKVSLSATEMDADDIVIVFSDVSGAEWFDLLVNIKTVPFTGGTVDDAGFTPTATSFDTDLAEATNDHFNDLFIVFISGALSGQARKISDYDGTNKRITVATALTEAPADGDKFLILGRSE